MRKVLIVGLGGSGGKTLSFLMDELRVRLGDEWNGKLPECWKFVHIDVPVIADTIGQALAAPVAAQGGNYVGLARRSTLYENFDKTAMDALTNQVPSALDMAVRWRPQPNLANRIAVAGGAGAFRAVGRMVTIATASNVFEMLKTVVEDLNSTGSNADLVKLSGGQIEEDSSPLVLMVSSMAGGSGASMVLDVADMIRGITSNKSFDGAHTSAFLYTPDVFQSIGLKGGAGSLATISELISALNRSEEPWNAKEWSALGIQGTAVPSGTGRGPFAIYPVGSKAGNVKFGETPEDIYRGFSRMLVPLFMDNPIQNEFYAYATTNLPKKASESGDKIGIVKDPVPDSAPLKLSHFTGWGAALLTMGRDRYAEYSAQRIARRALEILVSGHEDNDFLNKRINLQQAVQNGVQASYPLFLDSSGFSCLQSLQSPEGVKNFLELVLPPADRKKFAETKSAELRNELRGQTGDVLAAQLNNYLTRSRTQLKNDASRESLVSLERWTLDLQKKVEDSFLQVCATKGFLVAIDVLKKFNADLTAAQLQVQAALASTGPSPAQQSLEKDIRALANVKSPINPSGQHAAQILSGYESYLRDFLTRETAATLNPVISDLIEKFTGRLAEKAAEVRSELDVELRKENTTVVTAAYRTAPPASWPMDDVLVPSHFNPAVNEIIIDGVDQFPLFFTTHVNQATNNLGPASVTEAARQIITGMLAQRAASGGFEKVTGWSWQRNELGSHPVIARTRNWQPKEFSVVSGKPQTGADFDLKLNHIQVLDLARSWVELPSCPFRKHTDEGINSWLNPEVALSSNEADRRKTLFQQKFSETMTLASPLVEIDESAVEVMHSATMTGNVYNFSTVPIDQNSTIIQGVLATWAATSQGAINATNLRGACSSTEDKGEIFVLSKTAWPYLPMAFESLKKPIRDEWDAATKDGTTSDFWSWRRARPLRQFVPFSQRHLAAFVQGWIVGRLAGDIQLVDNPHDLTGSKIVRIWEPNAGLSTGGQWLEFPQHLLGVTSLGVARNAPGADESAWNVPAALLESLPLAMMHCRGLDFAPLKPYLAVIKLGASLKVGSIGNEPTGGPSNVLNSVDLWFNSGAATESAPQIGSAQGSTPVERKQNAQAWLTKVKNDMDSLLAQGISLDNFWSTNREYEIAPEISTAASVVLRELERPDLGTAVGGFAVTPANAGADNAINSRSDRAEG